MKTRAFTLIELLVVIAIIAILAAILFPVFAQAKAAAKGAASLSNCKQTTTAEIIYQADNDDKFVLDTCWGLGNGMLGWNWSDPNQVYSPWGWNVLPYMKNADILSDPLTQQVPLSWNSRTITNCEYPLFAYAYTVCSPTLGDWTTWIRSPRSSSEMGSPAQSVMFASHFDFSKGTGEWWFYGNLSLLYNQYTVEEPDCNMSPANCFGNWGSGWPSDQMKNNRTEGAFTGGVALRKTGQAVVSWTDGHASSINPAALAAGTNWTPNIAGGSLVRTDVSKYLWDEK